MADLIIGVTVDWEGEHLRQANLDAMTAFRGAFPGVPLTHFICPAYFSEGMANARQLIAAQLLNGDEVALHVHCWRSLIGAAHVPFRDRPNWDVDDPIPQGHSIPLSAYTIDEIRLILQTSKQYLLDNFRDFPVTGFRCGGWMANDAVITALARENFSYDSSMTDYVRFAAIADEWLEEFDTQLGFWLNELWGNNRQAAGFTSNTLSYASQPAPKGGVSSTQPFRIQVGDSSIYEMPDNAALIDYLTEDLMLQRFNEAAERAGRSDVDQYLVCGFHQESATGTGWPDDHNNNNIQNFSRASAAFRRAVADNKSVKVKYETIAKMPKPKKTERHGKVKERLWG